MGIFDDVITNAKSAAQTVGKVAGQFVDMSKLRLNLAELNGEINKRYQDLGQFIYEAKKAGEADEVELSEKIAVLDDLYAQFGAVSAQLAALQNKITCPACGKKLDMGAMFCSHCGMRLTDVNAEPVPAQPEEAPAEEAAAEAPAEEAAEPASEE